MIQDVPFTELLTAIVDNRGRTCPTADDGVPLIATNCVKNEGLYPTYEKVRYVDEETYDTWFRGHPEPGDILFVCKGSPGNVAVVPDPVDFCIAQDMVSVRADPDRIHPAYLFAALRSRQVQHQIETMHVGTLIPHFKKGDFHQLRIPVPSEESQRFIGDLYVELSEKIESCMRLRGTISELFSALYRSHIAGASQRCPLPAIATYHKGVSYRREELQPSSTALVTLKSFGRTGGYRVEGLKPYVGKYKLEQVLAPGDLAVAQTDLTQAAEVVGRVVRVPASAQHETLVASLDLAIVRPTGETDPEFLYGVLTDPRFREHCRSRTNGTTVLHLAKDALSEYEVPRVDPGVQSQFADAARPLLQADDSAASEAETLAALRDALLPELLAGRLRVPEAEELVADAI